MCLYLENKTKIFSERTLLLHFAPEDVFIDKFSSSSNIFYVNADIKSKKAMIHMDITNIPHKDDTFDIILCIHVLEHVEDDRKALRELFRVLKHQGQAILLNPVDRKRDKTFEDPKIVKPEDRKRMFGQEDHVRVYGKDFIYRLIEAGFRVEIEDYTIRFNNHMIEKHGLSRDDLIFLCVKN